MNASIEKLASANGLAIPPLMGKLAERPQRPELQPHSPPQWIQFIMLRCNAMIALVELYIL